MLQRLDVPSDTLSSPAPQSVRLAFARLLVDEAMKVVCGIWDLPSPNEADAAGDVSSGGILGGLQTNAHGAQKTQAFHNFICRILHVSLVSGWTVQITLCYIEAIRPKVAELIRQTQMRSAPLDHHESISVRTSVSFGEDRNGLPSQEASNAFVEPELTSPCRLPGCSGPSCGALSPLSNNRAIQPSCLIDEMNREDQLSTLLCPCRTFVAALGLASKFIGDRWCSNRAWAHLSGFSLEEVGQSERALGSALEWRLWVGKGFQPGMTQDTQSEVLPFADAHCSPTHAPSASPEPVQDTRGSPTENIQATFHWHDFPRICNAGNHFSNSTNSQTLQESPSPEPTHQPFLAAPLDQDHVGIVPNGQRTSNPHPQRICPAVA